MKVKRSVQCAALLLMLVTAIAALSILAGFSFNVRETETDVQWDIHSAMFALLYKINRNRYKCTTVHSLGGIANGDGVWPFCLDGWVKLDADRTRPVWGRLATNKIPPRGVYRPGPALRRLDTANRGLPRPPEPLERPPEGRGDTGLATVPLGDVATAEQLGNIPPCVALMFGSDWDFSWEDEFHSSTGCETHTFDPSLRMESHYRGEGQWFHNVGLSSVSAAVSRLAPDNTTTTWTVWSLSDALTKLNHAHISVLKVDIEGNEWDSLTQAFRDGTMDKVEQVLLEVHLWKKTFPKPDVTEKDEDLQYTAEVRGVLAWIDVFDEFERHGFRQYYHRTNPFSNNETWGDFVVEDLALKGIPCCFELGFVRVR